MPPVPTAPEPDADYQNVLRWIVEDIEDSGVELNETERTLLRGIKMFLRPTPQQYRLLFSLCEKCGVDWKPSDKERSGPLSVRSASRKGK
jgi:hypothetical protein